MKSLKVLVSIVYACLAVVGWSQPGNTECSHPGREARLITIDPPGAATAAGLGTEIPGINEEGGAAGMFTDSKFIAHGFFRTKDGKLTVFDAPGAGNQTVAGFVATPAGPLWGQGTYPYAINRQGAVAGEYADQHNVLHGFIRWPDGDFTIIDIEGAGTGAGQGSFAGNINDRNEVTGMYWDAEGAAHGFVRTADGDIITFDAPGAGTGSGQGTNPCCATSLNDRGDVSGWYIDAGNVMHGFLRMANGNIVPFEYSGAGTLAGQGTTAWSITPSDEVTGEVVDQNNVLHGYVRDRDGRITTFDAPGAGTNPAQGTIGEGIAAPGTVVGNYYDSQGVNHGYVRDRDGEFKFVDAPGAGSTAGQGTIPLSNNSEGKIVGAWFDKNGAAHGFIWIP